MSDSIPTPSESQQEASLEPFGAIPLTVPLKPKPNRARDRAGTQAMRRYLKSSLHWHSETELVRACRWALPRDDQEAADVVHRSIIKNSKVFIYRKNLDRKVTLVNNLRDGLVQLEADL